MDKDELIQEIGARLLRDPTISLDPWEHLAMVAQVDRGSTQVNGFAYLADGKAQITSPSDSRVPSKFEALREAMREPGKELWRACLVRIERASGRITVEFEHDHPEAWLIVPSTVKQMGETTRPGRG